MWQSQDPMSTVSLCFEASGDKRQLEETYARGGPFLICDHHTGNDFHASESTAATRVLKVFEDGVVDLLVVVHVVLVYPKLLGLLDQHLFVRHNDSDGTVLLRVGVNHDVGHGGSTAVNGLELLKSNVFSTLHLDKILDTVDNLQVATGVELANVTSLEPAVRGQSLSSLLRVVVVLCQNRLAPDPDLALSGARAVSLVSHVRDGYQLDLNRRRNRANSRWVVLERATQRAVGARFGETVTSQHGGKDQGQKVLGIIGNTAGPVHGETQATTGKLANLLEDNVVEDIGSWELLGGHESLVAKGTPEQVLEERAGLVELGHDTLLDSLPNLRDTNHDGRLQLAHISSAVLDRLIGQGAGVAVSEGATDEENQIFESHLHDVSQGQVGQNTLLIADAFLNAAVKTSN